MWCVLVLAHVLPLKICCTMTKKGWLIFFLLCHFSKFIMGAWKDLENQKKRRQARLKLGKMKKLKWQKWNSSDKIVQAVRLFFFPTMCYKRHFHDYFKSLYIILILVSVFQAHVVDVNFRFKKWMSLKL